MYAIHQIITDNKEINAFWRPDSGADGKGIQCIAQFDSWNPISGILRIN